MKNRSRMLNFIYKFLRDFNKSMNMAKLKKITDYNFYILEKIILHFNRFIPFYFKFYEEMVNEEIKMADISSNDKILHIGCGPIPATSIIIAEKTSAQIKAIDIDYNSVQKAKKVIKQYIKSKNIDIKNADGANFPISDFDIILVSDGVNKLYKILYSIGVSSNKNVKVIFRKTILDNKNYNLERDDLPKFFKIKEIKTHKSYGNLSSILLLKINPEDN